MIVLVLFTPSRLDLEGLPNRCSTASMCALASDVNNVQQHTVCSKTPVQVQKHHEPRHRLHQPINVAQIHRSPWSIHVVNLLDTS